MRHDAKYLRSDKHIIHIVWCFREKHGFQRIKRDVYKRVDFLPIVNSTGVVQPWAIINRQPVGLVVHGRRGNERRDDK